MTNPSDIVSIVLTTFPSTQAIYLFGSYGTENEWPASDADIALLLPHAAAKEAGSLLMSDLRFALETLLKRDVDLINLRRVSTVLQKEVIGAERRIFCANANAVAEFEMLVLSYYQELNQARREILQEFLRTKRAYAV